MNLIKKLFGGPSQSPTIAEKTNTNNNSLTSENKYYTGEYKDTNLFIRGSMEDGYFITFAQYTITEKVETIEECERLIKTRNIKLLMGLMCAMAEITYNHNVRNPEWYENINKTQTQNMEENNSGRTGQAEETQNNA